MEGVIVIRAIKYKNMWMENTFAHAHLWRRITQIEYSNQKIAQQVLKW